MDETAIPQRLTAAVEIAREAGRRTIPAFQNQQFGIETKQDGSPVTAVDRETELWIRARISQTFTNDGLLGEEHPEQTGTSGFRWVIDPIDGTASFIRGVPLYGTLVAVQHHDPTPSEMGATAATVPDRTPHEHWRTVIGVIAIPALEELLYASIGSGCWHIAPGASDPQTARVSRVGELAEATVCTTSLDYFAKCNLQRSYEQVAAASGMLRGWSDCYAHVLVATGRIDAAIEPSSINLWDVAGMPVIMSEAGGRYTDLQGREGAHWNNGLATNGLIHDALLQILRN